MMKVRSVRQLNSSSVRSNGGFSLLELIISIAILAIIIGPLMSAFVVSSQSVSKSKRLADQNAAAQMVYEKIQAEPGDYFFKWIRGDDKKKGYDDLLKYFGTSADQSMVLTSTLLQNSWDGLNKKDNHGDVVYLSLPNIYQNGALKYSAAVTLQAGTGNNPTDTETTADLKNGQILSDMNDKPRTQPMAFDNIFVQPTDASIDPDKLAEAAVTSRGGTIVSKKRTIYVHFTTSVGAKGTTDTTTYVQPVVCYCYDITYTSADGKRVRLYSVPEYNPSDNSITGFKTYEGGNVTKDVSVGYIDSSFSSIKYKYTDTNGKVKTDPINFYVCYQPYYESSSKNYREDIVIDNIDTVDGEAGVRGDVYLVKQNGVDSKPYSGKVKLLENHPDDKNFKLLVHTNMGLNNDMDTKHPLPGRYELRKFFNVDKSTLATYYGSGDSSSIDDRWYVDGSNDDSFTSLVNQKAEEHIYTVTIRIYDSLQLRTTAGTTAGTTYDWENGYYKDSSGTIEPRYTLTGIKRG